LVRTIHVPCKRISKNDIVEFLKGIISEQTGVAINSISVTGNLTSYGIDSIGVVKATQKLSDFLGTPVAAIDVFTASCIQELASFSEDLLSKTRPQLVRTIHVPCKRISKNDIVEFLKGIISEQTGVAINSISVTGNLTSYGIDSIGVVKATQKLSDFLGTPVAAIDVFTASCIQELASFSEDLLSKTRPQLVRTIHVPCKRISKNDIVEFLKGIISEQTGVAINSISVTGNLTSYGIDSIGVVKATQKLSDFLGTPVAAIDVFTASCIQELASFSEDLLSKTRPQLVRTIHVPCKRISKNDIVEFLKGIISEQTGVAINSISVTGNLTSYGIDSIGVVKATQKLSDFLGTPVAAIDVFTASCITELANFSEDLLSKTQPQLSSNESNVPEADIDCTELVVEVSKSRQWSIRLLQFFALIYISIMLASPAYLSITAFLNSNLCASKSVAGVPWLNYMISLIFAPLAWIHCIASTCICISLFGSSLLGLNYELTSEISIYSVDFVKWWALYKSQEISSKVLAVHLRGTVFLKYWFEMLGAKIGSSVLIDTVDITDPALVSIGDEAVIAEGVLVQSHEVKNGILSLRPIRIGKCSSIGPYAVVQKGSVIGESAEVQALQKVGGGEHVLKPNKLNNIDKNKDLPVISSKTQHDTIYHFIGIYLVGFLSSLAAAIAYFLYIKISKQPPSLQHFSFVCICGAFHWIPFIIIAYATMFSDVSSNPITFAISFTSAYLLHSLILITLTAVFTRLLNQNQTKFKTWLRYQMNISCHLRCAKFLSGTEAFCVYLRLLGAKIGKHCSIRAINPVSNPELMSIGAGVHIGDFSKIITGFHSSNGYVWGKIEVHDNSVIGSQSLILPNSLIQKNVILGALSLAPMNSILQEGGLYIGSQTQSHVGNLSATLNKEDSQKLTLTRTWYQTFTSLFTQPFLQTASPHILLGLSIYAPLNLIFHLSKKVPIFWLLPLFWILSGTMAALTCVIAKWVLVGKKKPGEKLPIWSKRIIMDSTWQAIRTLIGDYFMEMTSGSFMFVMWMKMMGGDVDEDVYVDSMGALLNPEMVKIERGGCVEKDALLFGHIYEGDEGGMVKFGEIKIGEDGFVGSRAMVMPGVVLENDANLAAFSLAMKQEIIRST
uniref:Uncharacterized protein LOC105851097 n=1 Tax=Cicer arietinum TaxID=3827 RepID=A0A1S3DY99_CICAR